MKENEEFEILNSFILNFKTTPIVSGDCITGIEAYSSYEMDDYSDSAYLYGICVN